MPSVDDLLARLWDDYASVNPEAVRIREWLESRGESPVHDHLAFRTFDDPRIGLERLAALFASFGYRPKEVYALTGSRVFARTYAHPRSDLPTVLLSELRVDAFSGHFRRIVCALVDQIPESVVRRWDFPAVGRLWTITRADYEALASESGFGAWIGAFGLRPSRFAVSVNHLKRPETLDALREWIGATGLRARESPVGGAPSPLEHLAIVGGVRDVELRDGRLRLCPGSYDFVRRVAGADGAPFTGFVERGTRRVFARDDGTA